MKQLVKIKNRWKGMLDTVIRFPLTIVLLAAAMLSNTISLAIEESDPYGKLLITFLLGALLSAVFRLVYERFFTKPAVRYLFFGVTALLSLLYYLCIRNTEWNTQMTVRTSVIMFILVIAFLWAPVIQSRYNFNDSFMAVFKGFFMSLLFHGVMYLGVFLIIGATDQLLFRVDYQAYIHAANILFVFFAPFYFLSMIPCYPGEKEQSAGLDAEQLLKKSPDVEAKLSNREDLTEEEITTEMMEAFSKEEKTEETKVLTAKEEALAKAITPARFLEALISYAIIPISAVFTIVLLLYIITNITGEFWSDNLMEPLLVTYSITVIIVYILASTIHNAVAGYFRKIFPKVLIPVVLFQTVASILKIRDVGITYGRYYVILFGIFATVAGVLFCINPVKKNGLIAPILIVLSVISILPVTGAFSVSRSVQVERLKSTLIRNDMLSGDTLIPNSNLSEEDQKTIISSVEYLNRLDYSKDIVWLNGYLNSFDFEEAFGFPMYQYMPTALKYIAVSRDRYSPIPVQGYDYIAHMYGKSGEENVSFTLEGDTYTIRDASVLQDAAIVLEKNGVEINRIDLKQIYSQFMDSTDSEEKTTQELTFTNSNPDSTLTVIIENYYGHIESDGIEGNAEMYILVDVK